MKPFLYLAARAAPRAGLSPSGLLASPAGSQEEGKEGKDPAETSATEPWGRELTQGTGFCVWGKNGNLSLLLLIQLTETVLLLQDFINNISFQVSKD